MILVSFLATAERASAAIVFRSAQSATSGILASSLAITKPTGLVAGDVMVATTSIVGTGAITAPAGWTAITNTTQGSAIRQFSWYKVAGASEAASYTFGLPLASEASGGIVAYSGVETSNPLNVFGTANGASGNAVAPSVTTTYPNAMVIVAVSFARNTTVTPAALTTERYDRAGGVSNEAADVSQGVQGATPTRTAVPANATAAWIAHTIALNEIPELTATFPSAYAWGSWLIGANSSSDQIATVISNRAWGVKIKSDRVDGRMMEWNGTSYVSRTLVNPLNWRLTQLGGVAQSTSFAPISSTPATVVTARTPSSTSVQLNVRYSLDVTYADDAELGANVYRLLVTYDSAQGF